MILSFVCILLFLATIFYQQASSTQKYFLPLVVTHCCRILQDFWTEQCIIAKPSVVPKLLESNFVEQNSGYTAHGVRSGLRKRGFHQINLLPGFWSEGDVSYLFVMGTTRSDNVRRKILNLGPWQEKNGPKIMAGAIIFQLRDPCLNVLWVLSCFIQFCQGMHSGLQESWPEGRSVAKNQN